LKIVWRMETGMTVLYISVAYWWSLYHQLMNWKCNAMNLVDASRCETYIIVQSVKLLTFDYMNGVHTPAGLAFLSLSPHSDPLNPLFVV
jgi:hypothetical protein